MMTGVRQSRRSYIAVSKRTTGVVNSSSRWDWERWVLNPEVFALASVILVEVGNTFEQTLACPGVEQVQVRNTPLETRDVSQVHFLS
jgi:hypothetical protein